MTVAILRVMIKGTLNRFIVEEKLMVGLVICMSNKLKLLNEEHQCQ